MTTSSRSSTSGLIRILIGLAGDLLRRIRRSHDDDFAGLRLEGEGTIQVGLGTDGTVVFQTNDCTCDRFVVFVHDGAFHIDGLSKGYPRS